MAYSRSARFSSSLHVAIAPTMVARSASRLHTSPILTSPIRTVGLAAFSTPPPTTPMPWMWSCHHCNSTYRVSVTRRCLHDGHYLCAVPSAAECSGRRRRQLPCHSVFDYTGWEAWGEWRRQKGRSQPLHARKQTANSMEYRRNCWRDCDSPSQCRWEREKLRHRAIAQTAYHADHDVEGEGPPASDDVSECGWSTSSNSSASSSSSRSHDSDYSNSLSSSASSSSSERCREEDQYGLNEPVHNEPFCPLDEAPYEDVSLEVNAWALPSLPTSAPRMAIPRSAPAARQRMPDVEAEDSELVWYRCLTRFADDDPRIEGEHGEEVEDLCGADKGNSGSQARGEQTSVPVLRASAPVPAVWDWSRGGLTCLAEQGIGLGGEMVERECAGS